MQSELTKQRNAENENPQSASTESEASSAGGLLSPQEQSQTDRQANYAKIAQQLGMKMSTNPASVKKEDGDKLYFQEVKAFGNTEKAGLASQVQSLVVEDMGGKKNPDTSVNAPLSTEEYIGQDREEDMKQAAAQLLGTMETAPARITEEDGDTMHSSETNVTGTTENGGLSSQVQSQAAKNPGMKK